MKNAFENYSQNSNSDQPLGDNHNKTSPEATKKAENPIYINSELGYVNIETDAQYQEKTLDSIKQILTDKNSCILAHGTGRSGDNEDIVNSIFMNGLRTKDNSITNTSYGLDVDENNIGNLQDRLNNWRHLDSKKIILMRIPICYINMKSPVMDDVGGLKYGAFYDSKIDHRVHAENGERYDKEVYYLSPTFIIGCYDATKGVVKMNPNFEVELSEASERETKDRYDNIVKQSNELRDYIENSAPYTSHHKTIDTENLDHPIVNVSQSDNIDDVVW